MSEVCIDDFSNESDKTLFACDDVSRTGFKFKICEEPGADVEFEERQLCSTKQKSRLNGSGGQQWCSGENKDVSRTDFKFKICEEPGANVEFEERQLCSTKQKSRLNGTIGQQRCSGENKDVSRTDFKLQICEEPGANVKFKERLFCSMEKKTQLNGTGGQQWCSGESNDVSLTGFKFKICEEPRANVEFEERQLCSTKQKSRLNGTGGQQRCSDESKDVSVTGPTLQICEEEGANGEERRLFSMIQKPQLNGTGGQQWCSGERKVSSCTEMKLQTNGNKGRETEEKGLFFKNGRGRFTEHEEWKWRSEEQNGIATRLMFAYKETEWPAGKRKQFSGNKIEVPGKRQEITVSVGVESNAKGSKESITQESDFKESESNRQVVETQKLDSEDGEIKSGIYMESKSKIEVHRRPRKGIAIRCPRDGVTIRKEQSAEESDSNGLMSRGCSPENEGYDNWLNKRHEHNMVAEPEQGKQKKNREAKTNTYQMESDPEEISSEQREEHSKISLPPQELSYQNVNYIQFAKGEIKDPDESKGMKLRNIALCSQANVEDAIETKCYSSDDSELVEINSAENSTSRKRLIHGQELSSLDDSKNRGIEQTRSTFGSYLPSCQMAEKEEVNVTGTLEDIDVVSSSTLSMRTHPSLAVQSTILKEYNMADRFGKGIPLNMPGRHKWIDRDESLLFHKHQSLFANQNEERRFLPIQQGFGLATGGRLADPRYHWGYFNNIAPMMYPVMGSGRMRGDFWASNTMSSEGGRHLKGSLEQQKSLSQALQNKKTGLSDYQVLNGKYDRENMDHKEHMEDYVNKQKPKGFNDTSHVGKSKEGVRSQSVPMKRARPSDSHLQNGGYDHEDVDEEEHTRQHAMKHQRCDMSQEIRSQVGRLKRTWIFDSHSQNGEYDGKTLELADHLQKKEHALKQQKIDGFKDTAEGGFRLTEHQALNGGYNRESMERRREQRKYHVSRLKESKTQKYIKVRMGERVGNKSLEDISHLKDKFQNKVINGHGADQPGDDNGLLEAESAEEDDREGEDTQMNQSQTTQKYIQDSVLERARQESLEELSYLKDKFHDKVINGNGVDHPVDENGFHDNESAEEDDREGEDRQMNQSKTDGSAVSEDNHGPVTKKRSKGKKQALCNPWGTGSYSDLITMALVSAAGKKMTLDEIYRWISINVPYFRDKGDELSSTGWKNSVRHTLSVRQRFVRLPRMLNGSVSHKSWWSLSNDFLRKRSPLGSNALNPSLELASEKQTTQGTQTEDLFCGWCSCTVLRR